MKETSHIQCNQIKINVYSVIKSNVLLLLCVDCGTFEVYKRHEGTSLCEMKQYCNKIAVIYFLFIMFNFVSFRECCLQLCITFCIHVHIGSKETISSERHSLSLH